MNVNINTDFQIVMFLSDNSGNVFTPANYAEYKLVFYTAAKRYHAYKKNGETHHLTEGNDGSITVYFDDPRFQAGNLNCEFTYYEQNDNYTSNGKAVTSILNVDVDIVNGNGDTYIVYHSAGISLTYIDTDANAVTVNGVRYVITANRAIVSGAVSSVEIADSTATFLQIEADSIAEGAVVDCSGATALTAEALNFMLVTLPAATNGFLKLAKSQLYLVDYDSLLVAMAAGYSLYGYDSLFYAETDNDVIINGVTYEPTNNKIIEDVVVDSISCSGGYVYDLEHAFQFPEIKQRSYYRQKAVTVSDTFTSLNGMFAGNSNLCDVDLLALDFSSITDGSMIFAFCQSLTDFSKLPVNYTDNLTAADGMFMGGIGYNAIYSEIYSMTGSRPDGETLTFADGHCFNSLVEGNFIFGACGLNIETGTSAFPLYTGSGSGWFSQFGTIFSNSFGKTIKIGSNSFQSLTDASWLFGHSDFEEIEFTAGTVTHIYHIISGCNNLKTFKIAATGWNIIDNVILENRKLRHLNLGGGAPFDFAENGLQLDIHAIEIIAPEDLNTLIYGLATSTHAPTLAVQQATYDALVNNNLLTTLSDKGWTVTVSE